MISRLLVVILGLSSALAYANPCALSRNSKLIQDGIGGTGLQPITQEITGMPPIRQDGIGGTGHVPSEDGLGGTGFPVLSNGDDVSIVGVVTGFASVCVNGLEIHYDQTTQVNINGQLASLDRLRVGQIARIHAIETNGRLVAKELAIHYELLGRVTSLDPIQRTAQIQGNTLKLSSQVAGLGMQQLSIGSPVLVSGYKNDQHEIIVTRLEEVRDHFTNMELKRPELSGKIISLQAVVETVSDTTVKFLGWPQFEFSREEVGEVAPGDLVEVLMDHEQPEAPHVMDLNILENDDLFERSGHFEIDYNKGGTENVHDSIVDKMEENLHESIKMPEHESLNLPEVPEHEAPEAPEYETPELPETPEYEAPELPETPEYEAPELPEAPEYEAPELPEAPEYEAPELPEIPELLENS